MDTLYKNAGETVVDVPDFFVAMMQIDRTLKYLVKRPLRRCFDHHYATGYKQS